MPEIITKYNPDSHPQSEGLSQIGDLRLLSINEARVILKLRHEKVKELIENGKIHVITIGQRIKIPMKSLIKFIDENTHTFPEESQRGVKKGQRDYINNKIDSIIKNKRKK